MSSFNFLLLNFSLMQLRSSLNICTLRFQSFTYHEHLGSAFQLEGLQAIVHGVAIGGGGAVVGGFRLSYLGCVQRRLDPLVLLQVALVPNDAPGVALPFT